MYSLLQYQNQNQTYLNKFKPQLIEVNGYEAWQDSLFDVFVRFFGHDRVQNTIGHD